MDFTNKYTNNDEEKILLRKIDDLMRRSRKTYSALYSHFLTPAEQALVMKADEFYGAVSLCGGYDEAERRLCRVQTEEYAEDSGAPIRLYHIKATAADAEFSHRDILGSLMGLGIKREMVGDIITDGSSAQFFCHSSVSEFIELNLQKVGRYRIKISVGTLNEPPVLQTEKVMINVSSMRLDSICAESFGVSRTKAAELIKKGFVSVNWLVCENISKEVSDGDKISMRSKGKVRIGGITGTSKKGRLFVDIFKYI